MFRIPIGTEVVINTPATRGVGIVLGYYTTNDAFGYDVKLVDITGMLHTQFFHTYIRKRTKLDKVLE